MVDEVKTGTRQRLLAAAESLLLTEPYDEVSVRGICTVAGANSVAVHYHFGSKEALVGALIEDRLGPLWADGLARATPGPDAMPTVVDTILAPFVQLGGDPLGRLHLRLLTRSRDVAADFLDMTKDREASTHLAIQWASIDRISLRPRRSGCQVFPSDLYS